MTASSLNSSAVDNSVSKAKQKLQPFKRGNYGSAVRISGSGGECWAGLDRKCFASGGGRTYPQAWECDPQATKSSRVSFPGSP